MPRLLAYTHLSNVEFYKLPSSQAFIVTVNLKAFFGFPIICKFDPPIYQQTNSRMNLLVKNDVIKWKFFSRYWPFVRRIHRGQRPVTRSFVVFFDLRPNKQLSKQWRGW